MLLNSKKFRFSLVSWLSERKDACFGSSTRLKLQLQIVALLLLEPVVSLNLIQFLVSLQQKSVLFLYLLDVARKNAVVPVVFVNQPVQLIHFVLQFVAPDFEVVYNFFSGGVGAVAEYTGTLHVLAVVATFGCGSPEALAQRRHKSVCLLFKQ